MNKARRKIYWTEVPAGVRTEHRPLSLLAKKARMLEIVGEWDLAEEILKANLSLARSVGNRSLTAEACIELGELAEQRSRYREAMDLAQEAGQAYQEHGEYWGTVKSMRLMAKAHLGWSDFPKALELLEQALDLSRRAGDVLQYADILGNMALTHYWMGDSVKAMELAERVRLAAEPLNNIKVKANVYHTIGRIHRENHEHEKAQEYLDKALALYRATGDLRSIAIALGSLGGMHYYRGRFDDALDTYRRQLEITKRLGEKYIQACAYGDMSSVYMEMGDLDNARALSLRELETGREIEDKAGISHSSYRLGLIEEEAGNLGAAAEHYGRAVDLARMIDSGRFLPDCLMARAWVNHRLGNEEEAELGRLAAMAEAERCGRKDVTNIGRWLGLIISHGKDPMKCEREMEILEQDPDSGRETAAEAFYHLWKETGKESLRDKARKAYGQLRAGRPRAVYERRLQELGG